MTNKQKIDWEAIEPGWRAGVKSVLQLAAEYKEKTDISVSHTAINKHFKKLGIPRDLNAKIQAKADAIVSAAMVSGKVSTETTIADAKIINDSALEVAHVKLSHRTDIRRFRKLVQQLIAELEQETENLELFKELGELMCQPDEKGYDKLNEIYHKVISTSSRSSTIKTLADTLKTLIALEREAFGIDKGLDKNQSIGEFLESLQ